MALPDWLARINRRFFNPREVRRGKRPVVHHIGRISGSAYATPLDAHEIGEEVLFIPLYGPDCDWVQNVMAAGQATLTIGEREINLSEPRLSTADEDWAKLPSKGRPPGLFGISTLLAMRSSPAEKRAL